MFVVASHLADLVPIDSILVCGVRASVNCSVLAVLESGQLLMLSLWQLAILALQMDRCTLFEWISSNRQLHYCSEIDYRSIFPLFFKITVVFAVLNLCIMLLLICAFDILLVAMQVSDDG